MTVTASKWASRKLVFALAGLVCLLGAGYLGLPAATGDQIVDLAGYYLVGQGVVDAAGHVRDYLRKKPARAEGETP